MNMPKKVRIVDVGPRDGLQSENIIVPTENKIQLIHSLAAAGIPSVESGAFVSPKWVPQMSDSEEVLKNITRIKGTSYPVLVPNLKGLERAQQANVEEIALFSAASETFSIKNTNCTINESIDRALEVCEAGIAEGMKVRGYISCALGCPYEGEIEISTVAELASKFNKMGCYEVSLGDTIGSGTPIKTRKMVSACINAIGVDKLAVHFHDTYGQALSNIYAVLQMGVQTLDTSVAGLGGCPYAKGATGNVATEDLVYMLHGMGIETGIDMEKLIDASDFICKVLDQPTKSKAALAISSAMKRSS